MVVKNECIINERTIQHFKKTLNRKNEERYNCVREWLLLCSWKTHLVITAQMSMLKKLLHQLWRSNFITGECSYLLILITYVPIQQLSIEPERWWRGGKEEGGDSKERVEGNLQGGGRWGGGRNHHHLGVHLNRWCSRCTFYFTFYSAPSGTMCNNSNEMR